MNEPLPIFAQRLAAALAARSPEQEQRILGQAKEQGSNVGYNGAVALLAGLSSSTVLSDILSGRTSGVRSQEALARVLEVDLRWLQGLPEGETEAPDWALPPLRAFRRWGKRLEKQMLNKFGRQAPTPGVDDESNQRRPSEELESQLARLLSLPMGHVTVLNIARKAWHAVAMADLLPFAATIGLPTPTHPQHLATGQALVAEVEEAISEERDNVRRRLAKFVLPARLFQLTRMALITLKAQRSYQGKDAGRVDDCLEILWRHQAASLGIEKRQLLHPFTIETGRPAWTPLSELQRRNGGPAVDITGRYDSEK